MADKKTVRLNDGTDVLKKDMSSVPTNKLLPPPPPIVGFGARLNHTIEQEKQNRDEMRLNISIAESRENATATEKAGAAVSAFVNASPLSRIMDELDVESKAGPKDKAFMEKNTFGYQINVLSSSGIANDDVYIDSLSRSVSGEDFQRRMVQIRNEELMKKYVNTQISTGAQTASSLAGAVLGDPTTFLGVYAIPKAIASLGLAARASAAFGSSLALQGSIAAVKSEYLNGYTANDAIVDTIFGGLVDGALARGIFKPSHLSEAVSPEQLALTSGRLKNSLLSSRNSNLPDMGQSYQWSSIRSSKGDSSVDAELSPNSIRVDGSGKDIIVQGKPYSQAASDARKLELLNKSGSAIDDVLMAIKGGDVSSIRKATGTTISDGEISARAKSLPNDAAELKSILEDIKNSPYSKDKVKQLDDVAKEINKIKDISVDAYNSLKFHLDEAKGVAYGKFAKTDSGAAYLGGKKKFEDNLKKMEQSIKSTYENLTDAASEISNYKFLKPIKKVKGISKEAEQRLSDIDTELGALKARRASKDFTKETKADAIAKLEKEADNIAKDARKNVPNKDRDRAIGSLNRQKDMYVKMAAAMDEVAFKTKSSIDDIIMDSFGTASEREIFANELSRDLNRAFGSDVKITYVDGKLKIEGKVNFKVDDNGILSNGKVRIGLALASVISADMTFAGEEDGSGDSGINIGAGIMILALALGFGYPIGAALLGVAKNLRNGFKRMAGIEDVAQATTSPQHKKMSLDAASIADSLRTGNIESLYTVISKGNSEARRLAEMLVMNVVDSVGKISVESSKKAMVDTAMARVHKDFRQSFEDYLKETNQKDAFLESTLKAAFEMTPLQVRFAEEVTDYIEFGGEASSAVKKFASRYKAERELMNKRLNEAGVELFDDESMLKFKDNHIARFYKGKNINELFNTEGGKVALENAFSKMIHSGRKGKNTESELAKSRKAASKLVDALSSSSEYKVGKKSIDNIMDALDEIGVDTSSLRKEDLSGELINDLLSRGKARIPLDLDAWEDFSVDILGASKTITRGDIFERNSLQLMGRLTHENYAWSETARLTGYKSYNQLATAIEDATRYDETGEVRKTMETYAKSLFNRPQMDIGSKLNRFISATRQISYVTLGTSLTTTFKEAKDSVGALFGRGGSSAARVEFYHSLGNMVRTIAGKGADNKHSALSDEMVYHVNAHGSSQIRKDTFIKAADDLTNTYEDAADDLISKSAQRAGRFGLIMSGLIAADDFFKRIASVYAATRVARVVHGVEDMSNAQRARYGISEEAIAKLRKVLKLNNNREVESLGFDNWDTETQDIFRDITDRIVMHRTTWTTLGGTPTGAINNEAGKLLSAVTQFMAQTYSSQAVAGIKYFDRDELFNQLALQLAGFVSYSAKSTITAREYNDEDAMLYALMMNPIMAPVSLASTYVDPVPLSVINRITGATKNAVSFDNGVTE